MNNSNIAPACAIYCRLSREDSTAGESESIQNQRNLLLRYAAEQGWQVAGIFCDDDYSGVDRERPEWNRLLKQAEAGRFEIVLCKNQSRFTRDMEMVEKYLHGLFPLWGVRFVAMLDHIDTGRQGGKKARQINGLVNEWYLEDLSDNVRAVLDQKRRAGQFIGSFAPYGYRKDPADHNHLVVDETAANVVRKIFRLYSGGMGTYAIARQLNCEQVPNPAAYKSGQGLSYCNGGGQGTLWHTGTVSRILRNEVYLGTLVQGTKRKASYKSHRLLPVPSGQWFRSEQAHEAVIDATTFTAVQKKLQSRTRSDGCGKRHVLAGKVFCAGCGAGMVKVSHTYQGNRRNYLQCARYAADRQGGGCTRHSIRLERLTEVLEGQMRVQMRRMYMLGNPMRFSRSAYTANGKKDLLHRERERLNRRLETLKTALQSLYLDQVEGVVTRQQFLEMNAAFLQEQQQLERRASELADKIDAGPGIGDTGLENRVRQILTLEKVGYELYDLLVERVQIGEKNPQTGEQPVEVWWRI